MPSSKWKSSYDKKGKYTIAIEKDISLVEELERQ